MLIDAIINAVLGVLTGIMSLFPAWSPPSALSGFGSSLGSAFGAAGGIFPVTTLGLCLAAVLVCWLFVLGFQAVVFIYKLLPFKAT